MPPTISVRAAGSAPCGNLALDAFVFPVPGRPFAAGHRRATLTRSAAEPFAVDTPKLTHVIYGSKGLHPLTSESGNPRFDARTSEP